MKSRFVYFPFLLASLFARLFFGNAAGSGLLVRY